MRVAFRTDASLEIGTGHVMRCLTLADALRARGVDCVFVCRPHAGHLMSQIIVRGHRCLTLSRPHPAATLSHDCPPHGVWLGSDWGSDASETRDLLDGESIDWLIVDHYALERRWEQLLRPACRNLMVMDDLADRAHDCDLLLDPSLGRSKEDYARLIPDEATALLGPRHALLRPEFPALRAESLARRTAPELRHLLVTLGGIDKDNITGAVLDGLDTARLPDAMRITVVMGPHAPWLEPVRARAARMGIETAVRVDVTDMARLMADSDLAVGAGGGTSWERCCLGLPAFLLSLADNQRLMARTLQDAGAVIAVDTPEDMAHRLGHCIANGGGLPFLASAGAAAANVTDGQGSARVCRALAL